MTYDRPPAQVPATPDYVLDVIRDQHRQSCEFDPESDTHAELTFETTIAEWREACDLIDWRRLARALDGEWRLGRPDAEWRAVLEPARERTLRDLCDFIARGASRPTIEALTILGSSCLPAGAFLAIRSILREAGADASPIRPSTPLDDYTRRHLATFLGPISRLAPGAIPAVKMSTPWHDLGCAGFGIGGLITVVASYLVPPMAIVGIILALASCGLTWISATYILPSRVEFGGLRTFRDLACVVAEGVSLGRVRYCGPIALEEA